MVKHIIFSLKSWFNLSVGKLFSEQVSVIAPDDDSGRDFQKTLQKCGLKTKYYLVSVPARVISDESGNNKITEDIKGVSEALAKHIRKVVEENKNLPIITIACNALSLEIFVRRAKSILLKDKDVLEDGVDYKLVTTISVLKNKYKNIEESKRPIVLGTVVVSDRSKEFGLESPSSMNLIKLRGLVQELIWRVKAVGGLDVSTAPKYGDLFSREALIDRGEYFIELLKKKELYKVVLVCTELPVLHKILVEERVIQKIDPLSKFNFIDPAELVVESIKRVLD